MSGIAIKFLIEPLPKVVHKSPKSLHRAVWGAIVGELGGFLGEEACRVILEHYIVDEGWEHHRWSEPDEEDEFADRGQLSYRLMDCGGACVVWMAVAEHWFELIPALIWERLVEIAAEHGFRFLSSHKTLREIFLEGREPGGERCPFVILRDRLYCLRIEEGGGWLFSTDDGDGSRLLEEALTSEERGLVELLLARRECGCELCGVLSRRVRVHLPREPGNEVFCALDGEPSRVRVSVNCPVVGEESRVFEGDAWRLEEAIERGGSLRLLSRPYEESLFWEDGVSCAIHPTGECFVILRGGGREVQVCRWEDGGILWSVSYSGEVEFGDVQFSSSGDVVLVSVYDREEDRYTIELLGSLDGRLLRRLDGGDLGCFVLHPEGEWLLVYQMNRDLRLVHLESGEVISPHNPGHHAEGIALNADGSLLATRGACGGPLWLRSFETGEVVLEVLGVEGYAFHPTRPGTMAIASGGRILMFEFGACEFGEPFVSGVPYSWSWGVGKLCFSADGEFLFDTSSTPWGGCWSVFRGHLSHVLYDVGCDEQIFDVVPHPLGGGVLTLDEGGVHLFRRVGEVGGDFDDSVLFGRWGLEQEALSAGHSQHEALKETVSEELRAYEREYYAGVSLAEATRIWQIFGQLSGLMGVLEEGGLDRHREQLEGVLFGG